MDCAVELLEHDNRYPYDVHAAAHVFWAGSGRGVKHAWLRIPCHRRARIEKVVDILRLIPVPRPEERERAWDAYPTTFAELACDAALVFAVTSESESARESAAAIAISLWSAVAPTPERCLALAAAARRNIHQPCSLHLIRLLRSRVATDDLVYGAIVEIAARVALEPERGTWCLPETFLALREAPRLVLPLAWFLAYAQYHRHSTTSPNAVWFVRKLLTGLVDENDNEPVQVARWRDENAAWLALSCASGPHNWPVQVVRI